MDLQPDYDEQTREQFEYERQLSSDEQIQNQSGQQTEESYLLYQKEYDEEKIIFTEKLFPIQKTDLQNVRHYTLGAFTFKNANKQLCVGSGVLISKNIILTAAHNIFDINYGKNTSHKFYLGANGVTDDYYQIQDYRYPEQFQKIKEVKNDFALVKLKKDIRLNKYLQLSVPCYTCLKKPQKIISVYGYPAYESNYSCKDRKGVKISLHQYGLQRDDRIIQVLTQECRLCYSLSTFYGHSGSPVCVDDKIIAVHVGSKSCQDFNRGRLITPEMILILKQWCKQLKGDLFKVNQKQCTILHSKQKTINQNKASLKEENKSKPQLQLKKTLNTKLILNTIKAINPETKQSNVSTERSFASTQQIQKTKQPNVKKNTIIPISKSKLPIRKIIMSNSQKAKQLLKRAIQKYNQKEYQEALQIFLQTLQILERGNKKESIEIASTLGWIGDAYNKNQSYKEAKKYYKHSISIYESNKFLKSKNYAYSLRQLGEIYEKQNKFGKAIQLYQQAIQIYQSKTTISAINQKIKNCLKMDKIDQNSKKKDGLKSSKQLKIINAAKT